MDTGFIKKEKIDSFDSNDGKTSYSGEDEDDPVVEEIPVYMAKGLDCYLLQYPVRPASMPYDSAVMEKIMFRPNNQQIEMHMALNTDNDNYDASRGEQIALNVDGDKGHISSSSTFSSGKMDSQVLTGGRAVTDTNRYAVGILNNNELHLTQVKGVMSVRPNLTYLDKSDKRSKQEGRNLDPDEPAEVDEKPEAITVKFNKPQTERTIKWKEKSYQTHIKKEADEPWLNMHFNQLRSVRWDDESQNLFCENMHQNVEFKLPSEQYLQSFK